LLGVFVFTLTGLGVAGDAFATTINTPLDVGSTGTDVAVLQTYLAQDTDLYPEALVTGYYGPKTRAAVGRFQCRESIVCQGEVTLTGYGRVGPKTRTRLNELMKDMTIVPVVSPGAATGTGGPDITTNSVDDMAPVIQPERVVGGDTTAIIGWMANEPAYARVYYATSLPVYVTPGSRSAEGTVYGPVQQVTLIGLVPNTTYYYVRESRDVAGNTTLTLPKVFTTGAIGQMGTHTGTSTTTTGIGTPTPMTTSTASGASTTTGFGATTTSGGMY